MSKTQATDSKLYTCQRCADEQLDALHPISDFYTVNVREYKTDSHWVKYARGVRRSAYCKMHHDRDTSARLRAKLDPTSPDYDPQLHASQKASKRSYYARKMKPDSPDYDADLHARHIESNQRYRREGARSTRRGSHDAPGATEANEPTAS